MDFDEMVGIYLVSLFRMIIGLLLFIILYFTHNADTAIKVSAIVFTLAILVNEHENLSLFSLFITLPIYRFIYDGAYASYAPVIIAAGIVIFITLIVADGCFDTFGGGIFAFFYYSLQAACVLIIIEYKSVMFAIVSLGIVLAPLLLYGLARLFIMLIEEFPPSDIETKTIKHKIEHGGIYRSSVVAVDSPVEKNWLQRFYFWFYEKMI